MNPHAESISINQQLIAGIFGSIADFLRERGCPLSEEQREALNEALNGMGMS